MADEHVENLNEQLAMAKSELARFRTSGIKDKNREKALLNQISAIEKEIKNYEKELGKLNKGQKNESSSSSSSSSSSGGEYLSLGFVTLIFAFGLLNYYYDYNVGFERTVFANTFDVIMYVVSIFYLLIFRKAHNEAFKILLPYFLLEFALPYIANGITTFVTFDIILKTLGVFLILPWWLIGAFFLNSELPAEERQKSISKLINLMMILTTILIISVYIIPAILAATVAAPTGIVNTQAIQEGKALFIDGLTTAKDTFFKFIEFQRCSLLEPTKVCETRIYHQEELQRVVRENSILETTFKMDVVNFFAPGKVPSNYLIRNYVPVKSEVQGAFLTYSCGFKGAKESGTPTPDRSDIGKKELNAIQNSVACQLNRSKLPKTPYYYFNATASQVIASGYKEIIIVGEDYKKSILDRVPGAYESQKAENDALRRSVRLGPIITERERQNLFGPAVGKEDLARPVLQDGYTSGVGTELPLVYGITPDESSFDLAIFIKNNGPGKIKEIKSIHVIPDEDIRLTPDNCGIDIALTKAINANLSIQSGDFLQVSSCQFFLAKALTDPNNVNLRTIRVNMVYDYIISKEVSVST